MNQVLVIVLASLVLVLVLVLVGLVIVLVLACPVLVNITDLLHPVRCQCWLVDRKGSGFVNTLAAAIPGVVDQSMCGPDSSGTRRMAGCETFVQSIQLESEIMCSKSY